MKIYEIDREIEKLLDEGVDPETGELLIDTASLETLQMDRDRKVENLALYIKNAAAEAKAIRDEEKALGERRKALEKRGERAKDYLEFVLGGEKFQTARVAVSYRSSSHVELDEKFIAWAKRKMKTLPLLRVKEPEPDKTAIAAALKSGKDVKYARLVTDTSLVIK